MDPKNARRKYRILEERLAGITALAEQSESEARAQGRPYDVVGEAKKRLQRKRRIRTEMRKLETKI